MDLTQAKGNITELQVIIKFISMGFECSVPYGNQAKYDLLVDLGQGEIIRIQVKKARWADRGKTIVFSCSSQTTNTKKTVRHNYTKEQVDYFATCWEDNVYLVPVDECSTQKQLRVIPKENGTPNTVNMAEDYLVEKVVGHLAKLKPDDFSEEIPIRFKKLNKELSYKCIDCGIPVSKNNQRCILCYKKLQRKNRPSREELKQLIRNESFLSIGKKFGVSDNAIRKWCDDYNLPRRKTEINKINEEVWKTM